MVTPPAALEGIGLGGRRDLGRREGFETIQAAGIIAPQGVAAMLVASPWIRLFPSKRRRRPIERWADDGGRVIEIRQETAVDSSAVREVNELAFGGTAEAQLVDVLRAAKRAVVSLVALNQGRIVGHILFSPVTVARTAENFRGVGLAPMSVLPEFQNQGIGTRLVRDGLEACKQKGYDAVVVLGHTKYYPRFGFSRAKDHGLDNEYDALDSFMVLELKEGVLQTMGGLVRYAPEFGDAGC